MKVFYNDKYTAPVYVFETTRKSHKIAQAILRGRAPGSELVDPADTVGLAAELITQTHDRDYVEALRTGEDLFLAGSQGFTWDKGIWDMAVNSTAGVLAAVATALETGGFSGSLSSGLHHARRDEGRWYCTVNGLAIAATWAADQADGQVVILDVDAHCGGGTTELVGDDPRILHLDLSVSSLDEYEPSGDNQLVFPEPRSDSMYLEELDRLLDAVPEDTSLVILNAGMDPHPTISAEALAERERRVADWCVNHHVPAVFVLAGGYIGSVDMDGLIDLHLHTVRAFAAVSTDNLERAVTACS